MERYYWVGYCKENRIVATEKIAATINEYGCMLSANIFSDLAISFTIEINRNKVIALYNALNSYIRLKEQEMADSESTEEITIMLNVTFAMGTGSLRIEVPSVPG